MLRGIFSRGSSNVNIMESQYRLNPAIVALGITLALVFQAIALIIVYFALAATSTAILVLIILIGVGDIFIFGIASYLTRLYLREEMIDMAMLFANYNPHILDKGKDLIGSAYDGLKMARQDVNADMQLRLELMQLRDELNEMLDKNPHGGFTPLINGD